MTTTATGPATMAAVPSESGLQLRLLEKDLIPDALIRVGIRRLLAERLREEDKGDPEAQQAHLMELVEQLRRSPIAVHTDAANAQHYEVPSEFYHLVLGRHLKYSCCYYDLGGIGDGATQGGRSLDEAEAAMLDLTCRRARLADGERILELGCGWGSLTLYMAARFPNARITGVSNSRTQREWILARAAERGLGNVEIVTCDANVLEFPAGTHFDRAVSVEMFEHMRNYESLLGRIASWLAPGGTLFVHIFTHREYAYPFEVRDESDWMAKYFFTGGIMPSDDLLTYFQKDLKLDRHWQVDGRHYQRTAEDWLVNMDRNRERVLPLLAATYGAANATRWWVYWRVFFMACAELWGYRGGREWLVSHYLFEKPRTA
jgi:cyclopropane-fatty-acyl-phospholipid synthase